MRFVILLTSLAILVSTGSFSRARSSDNLSDYWVGESEAELVTSSRAWPNWQSTIEDMIVLRCDHW